MGVYPCISYISECSLLDNHILDNYIAYMALHALLYELDIHHEFYHHVGLLGLGLT